MENKKSVVTLKIDTPRASERAAEFVAKLVYFGAVIEATQDGDWLTVVIDDVRG